MHPFATNCSERKHVPFFIALIAVGAGIFTSTVLSALHIEVPWWAPPLDTMTYYGCLYWLFDRLGWKSKFIRALHISEMPLLAGRWHGRVTPADADGVSRGLATATDIDVTIEQTWTSLLVRAETTGSVSRSVSASLMVDAQIALSYEYINEPRASAAVSMHMHRGTGRFVLNGNTVLEGEYYSGRDRQTFGTVRLERVSGGGTPSS